MEIKSIELFGKSLFNWVNMEQLVHMPTPMPDNEAGFVYILKGSCVNYSETEELNLTANEAVLAKCGNNMFRTFAVDDETTYQAISIRFHKDILEKIYSDSKTPFFKNTRHQLTVNSVKVQTNKLITQYISNLVQYFDNKELLTEELLTLKLKELIALLLQTENAPEVQQIMSNLYEKKTFEFKEIIKAHTFSSISIQELAQLTNLSLSSFKKEFKKIYNDTPNRYIIDQRIEKVAKSLLQSNESISSIAYDCEFKTLAHMSRVFKNKYNISPTEFRQNFLDK